MRFTNWSLGKKYSSIYILGKGRSKTLTNVPPGDDILLISANDAALEIADIVIHTNPQLSQDFLQQRMKPTALLVSTLVREGNKNVAAVSERTTFELTPAELVADFLSPEILFQGYTVLLCLRVAEEVSKVSGLSTKAYLVGFDFLPSEVDNQSNSGDYSRANLVSQRRALSAILSKKHLLQNTVLQIGSDSSSDMTPEVHNRLLRANPTQVPSSIDDSEAVEIVAEITTNHFGDWSRLEQMVRRAKASGADSVKFQKRDTETFYSKEKLSSAFESPFGHTFGDYRRALEFDLAGFTRVEELCREVGIGWFTSVLDKASFDFLLQFEPNRVKLPSTISEHTELLEHVSENFRKEIVVSTGFTDFSYETKVRDLFRNATKLYLLQCVSAYPARNTDTQLGVVRHYHDLSREAGSNVVPGYSSHDIGSLVSMLAVAAGARMLEKHVKLGVTEWAHFDEVAVDLSDESFSSYTTDVREAQAIVGGGLKRIQPSEHHKYWL